MKIIQKETPTESVRAVDWTQPLVVFDPWPFHLAGVKLDHTVWYLNPEGEWADPAYWTLEEQDDKILGVTTLGEPFLTSQTALDRMS